MTAVAGTRRQIILGAAAGAAAALALAGASTATAVPSGWATPVQIATGAAGQRDLAVAPGGHAAAAWGNGSDGQIAVRATHRLPGGAWAPPVLLSSTGLYSGLPRAAVAPDGTAVAVWVEVSPGGFERVRASWRAPDGGWDTTPDTVSDTGDGAEVMYADVAITPAGRAVVVWSQGANLQARRVHVREGTLGGGFGAIGELSAAGVGADEVRVATDASGAAHAMWTQTAAGSLGVLTTSRGPGAAWPSPSAAVPIASGAYDFDLAVSPDGGATAVYTGPNGDYRLWALERAPGQQWDAQDAVVLAEHPTRRFLAPSAGRDATGRSVAAWTWRLSGDPMDTATTGQMKVESPEGGWPQLATGLTSPAGGGVSAVDAAMSGDGTALVAWQGSQNGLVTVPAGQTAAQRSTIAQTANQPTLAADDAGNAVLLFTAGNTWASVLDTTAPIVAVAAPTTLGTGEAGSFQAAATDAWSAVSVAWAFGDGATGSGAVVSHAFAAPGPFSATATATDAAGNTASVAAAGTVTAPPPAPAAPPASGDGAPSASPAPAAGSVGRPVPRVTGVRVLGTPRASVPLRVRLRLAQAGRVTVVLQRRVGAARFRTVRATAAAAGQGAVTVRLRGVAPGRYRIVVTAGGQVTRTPVLVRPRR